jgi:serine protease
MRREQANASGRAGCAPLVSRARRAKGYGSVMTLQKPFALLSPPHRRGNGRILGIAIVIAALALTASPPRPVHAQSDDATPPHRMLLTPERALAAILASDRKLDYVPGEVLVKFRSGVSVSGQQRALSALRSRPSAGDLRWVGDTAVVTDGTELDARILAAQLASQPEVAAAEPNYLYRTSATPNDPGFAQRQWNMTALDMPRAWDINPGANDTIVAAIVDTGITSIARSYTFQTWNGRATQTVVVPFTMNPDIKAARIVDARDFVFWDGPVLDMEGHGTHVASTIGEDANNALAEAGIANRVKLMPVKVCFGFWEVQFVMSASGYRGFVPREVGGCPTSEIADGIRYAADRGAKVINISLGGPEPSTTIRDALSYAVGKGAFVAIAMGNEYEDGDAVSYPAADAATIDGVMSVGAVGRSLVRSYYSNTGPHIEIVAPGGDDRDGGAAGMIWQSTIFSVDSDPDTVILPRFDRYAETAYEGTSMATPHVTGIAALLVSQGVTKPAAVESLIKKTARFLGTPNGATPGRNDEYGYGLIQPRAALLGFGLAR